jgi:hypothetical protein
MSARRQFGQNQDASIPMHLQSIGNAIGNASAELGLGFSMRYGVQRPFNDRSTTVQKRFIPTVTVTSL